MREYPTIPNVFRVGSTSSINILDANNAAGNSNRVNKNENNSTPNGTSNVVRNHLDGSCNTILSTDNLRYHNVINSKQIHFSQQTDEKRINNKLPTGTRNSHNQHVVIKSISGGNAADIEFQPAPSDTAATIASNNSIGSDLNRSINSFTEITSFPHTNANRSYTNERSGGYFLWIMTPVAASVSVALVLAALAGPQWLFTEEKLPNSNYNGTANFNAKDDGAYITKYSKSSLWILCSALQGMESSYNCIKIDYFPKEGYQPDPLDSTAAIPYTVTKSCPFFLASGAVLLISFIVFLVPTCSQQSNLYYFTSGIMFIMSGLFMLIGLIAYISILKAAIGSKLRPRSTLQPALFKVTYGQSFFLFVFGFITTEFVGVLNIFLYISLQQVGQYKKISCLSFMNIPGKRKELENEKQQFHRHEQEKSERNRYMCKKHPIPSSFLFANDYERRYFFEKSEKCDLHSKNLAKSLNELYTEPAPTFSTFEVPPQDLPLTRSVSTTTELFANNNKNHSNGKKGDDNGEDDDGEVEAEDGNTDNGSSSRIQDICGLSRGIRKTKDELFNEFCKRAGMRPKPKDIYYIEDNDGAQDENIYIVDNGNLVAIPQSHPMHPNHQNYHQTPVKNHPHRRNSTTNRERGREQVASEATRRRNSNISLHSAIATNTTGGGSGYKMYPKTFFESERSESEIWNNYPEQYFMRKDYNMYHSRTLPKSFLKRNYDSQESIGGVGGGAARSHSSREAIHHSGRTLHKSCEDINSLASTLPPPAIQWPTAIPTSPSNFSAKASFGYPALVPAPTAAVPLHQKFTRGFALDDRRPDGFDLDEIERDRRKSHSSLFDPRYDMINGTAV